MPDIDITALDCGDVLRYAGIDWVVTGFRPCGEERREVLISHGGDNRWEFDLNLKQWERRGNVRVFIPADQPFRPNGSTLVELTCKAIAYLGNLPGVTVYRNPEDRHRWHVQDDCTSIYTPFAQLSEWDVLELKRQTRARRGD